MPSQLPTAAALRPPTDTLARHSPGHVCRARQAQAALEAARAAYDALAVEHARLQEARRLEEREGFEVASLLRQELAAKAQALAALEARLGAGADRVAEVESEAVAREAAAAAAHAAERVALQQAADTLQARLDGLAQFQAQKDNLVAEMQWLRQENARIAQESGGKVRVWGGGKCWLAELPLRKVSWLLRCRHPLASLCSTGQQYATDQIPAPQVRALQRRLHELEHADEGGAPGSGGEEEACTEAEVHRLLEHSRRGAAEMQQYLQVRGHFLLWCPPLTVLLIWTGDRAHAAMKRRSQDAAFRSTRLCAPSCAGGGGAAAGDEGAGDRARGAAAGRAAEGGAGAAVCQARDAAGGGRASPACISASLFGCLACGGWRATRAPLSRWALLRANTSCRAASGPQARKISSAQSKISSLEKGLVRMAADFEQVRYSGGGEASIMWR